VRVSVYCQVTRAGKLSVFRAALAAVTTTYFAAIINYADPMEVVKKTIADEELAAGPLDAMPRTLDLLTKIR